MSVLQYKKLAGLKGHNLSETEPRIRTKREMGICVFEIL